MNGTISIRINELTKNFGATHALNHLSAEFAAGSLHGIIGPDGAGKTTLLRIVSGLLHPSSGTVEYVTDGAQTAFESLRPSIGYMPSRASLYPDLSIEEHMVFFKNLYQIDEHEYARKHDELLAMMRLEAFKDRKAGALSGGMYKKAALMCTLLRSPRVLLLDEPTNGVDPISRREFWELLYRSAAENILIITATAYMDEAERCGTVHLIDSGRQIATGEPGALLEAEGAKDFGDIFIKKTAPAAS